MLLEILKRTPSWVFALFAALVFFGAMQSRTRQITLARVAILLNQLAKWPRKVAYTAATRSFLVEGSWLPLAVMMLIFFTRYAVTVTLAINPGLAASPWLATGVSAAYGLMSGAFLARALRILGSAKSAGLPA